jgi:glutamate-ammonia-ligase adenylyltransferase
VTVADPATLPVVAQALDRSADPVLARAGLARIVEAQPAIGDAVAGNARVREAVVAILCASRSLTQALATDASLLDPLLAEDFDREQDLDAFHSSWSRADAHDPDGLRRWKRREYLRIAARDLTGVADLPTVGRELAALAQVALGAAVRIADPAVPFVVIGMGKLGGRELNYASDVDVLFAHAGDQEHAERAARRVLSVMAEPTPAGIVFRTDADLRPEGRSGALSRTVDSYAAWWERWAQTWEKQALIKARPVAGDEALGAAFLTAAEPVVWPAVLGPDAVREVRAMKARAESETARRGLTDRELKRGRGGIRDIEFAVQLLQLVHGRQDPSLRSPTTLDALAQLVAGGYVNELDARPLDAAYRFLRTVEHRLQLWDEQQTHTVPTDVAARVRLARVLGYRDAPGSTALAQLEAEQRGQQARARAVHEKLFFGPLLEALAGKDGPLPPGAAEERARAFGCQDVAAARAALDELTRGFTRTSRLLAQLLPLLLDWCSESPDPDLALLQLRRLAEGPARSASLATTFRDAPGAAERTCRLLGASRMVGDALRRQPQFVATLGDDDALAADKGRAQLVGEALASVRWRAHDADDRRSALQRFKQRELLRVAARDLLGFADLTHTGHELSSLAEACLEAALAVLVPHVPMAVIAMGRFGGLDLSYASDLDVLFVYDGAGPSDFREAERVAEGVLREVGEAGLFRIDPDLRPEGKQGSLTRSLEGYRDYWERWALTWERQTLLKARPGAGNLDLALRFCAQAAPFVYRDPLPDEAVLEIRRMKARIERERIAPGDDPEFHLKLGRGSLSDIEFTVQLLQLRHGARHQSVRRPETTVALEALAAVGLMDEPDRAVLREAYDYCSAARNARFLVTGSPRESLPQDPWDAERTARLLGYVHRPQATLRDDYRRLTRRSRAVVDRLFYGRD